MIKNEETGWTEASITINSRALNFAESMVVRIAIEHFHMWLCSSETVDALGPIGPQYKRVVRGVMDMIHDR